MVKLVGVVNITPDSFSDGGKFKNSSAAVAHAKQLFREGATIVDVGAESTRPNATPLSLDEEWNRLEPVLKELIPKYPGRVSLDSYHPKTILKAFEIGPVIINDVTGLNNQKMIDLVKKLKPTIIVSHLPGTDIQKAHQLMPVSDVAEIRSDLLAKAKLLQAAGLSKAQIILDPGIGFGKTMELNKELLKFADLLPGFSVMIGYSRKRFLGQHRMELAPNLVAGKIAIAHGAEYLRVHDVAGHAQLLK